MGSAAPTHDAQLFVRTLLHRLSIDTIFNGAIALTFQRHISHIVVVNLTAFLRKHTVNR
jgi:hypothetical protein